MSRLGKIPIKLPAGTQVKIEPGLLSVKGPKGELKLKTLDSVILKVENDAINVAMKSHKTKNDKAVWGLFWSLIRNMVKGVNEGFKKELEVVGVGFRVNVTGRKIVLSLGFSHPVEYALPDGVNASAQGNIITIEGCDKQLVGEVAAQIRRIKKPEPYKGKGIKYVDEVIRRKEGKTAVKGD